MRYVRANSRYQVGIGAGVDVGDGWGEGVYGITIVNAVGAVTLASVASSSTPPALTCTRTIPFPPTAPGIDENGKRTQSSAPRKE